MPGEGYIWLEGRPSLCRLGCPFVLSAPQHSPSTEAEADSSPILTNVPSQPREKDKSSQRHPMGKGKGKPENALFSLGTATLGRGEQRQVEASLSPSQRHSCPPSPVLASHPDLLQLFQMVAVSQTRCQVDQALCAYTAGGQSVGDQRVAGQAEPRPPEV